MCRSRTNVGEVLDVVEAFVSQVPVEGLHEGCLLGRAGLDVGGFGARDSAPVPQRHRDEFGAVVHAQVSRRRGSRVGALWVVCAAARLGRVGSVAVWRGRLGRLLPVAIAARGGFAAFTLDAGSSMGGYLQAAWVGYSDASVFSGE